MYSVADFGRMIDDDERMAAFRKALAATIDSESVVLDVGAGTGIMSLLACRYGAKRVYALEPYGAIQIAREVALLCGLQTFCAGCSVWRQRICPKSG